MFTPWPHQTFAVEGIEARRFPGHALVLTIPTGGGKSWVAGESTRIETAELGGRTVIYTNRRILIGQLMKTLAAADIPFGVRAAGHQDNRHLPVQISSLPTENSRVLKRERSGKVGGWALHDATKVIVDEAHLQKGPVAETVIRRHRDAGAFVLGLTATPLDLAMVYDELFVAARNSELRRCGALVACRHTAPDEPDLRDIGRVVVGEDLTEKQCVQAIMRAGVAGRVYESWRRDNPDGRPTILFAPGVAESVWFCQQFLRKGVRCAHIDGKQCWVNGTVYDTSDQLRSEIIEMSRLGDISMVSNRFVMREGVDMPWLYHGILATVFGSLASYLQACGRLLRFSPTTPNVVLTDHGGNWWRHGSVNADRDWKLGDTAASVANRHLDRMRDGDPDADHDDPPPTNCPRCGGRLNGRRLCPVCEPRRCPECLQVITGRWCPCGYEYTGITSRSVVQSDGSLIEVDGPAVRPRQRRKTDTTEHQWTKAYWRAWHAKKGMTFRQAEALFFREHGYYPPRNLPMMPRRAVDWYSVVKDVPRSGLY